uniref:MTTase N-terminal domain-containing protein n=1 Tax=Macrostomum lignano TaxID=282301 RepID=A0A1I8FF21_9PLAT
FQRPSITYGEFLFGAAASEVSQAFCSRYSAHRTSKDRCCKAARFANNCFAKMPALQKKCSNRIYLITLESHNSRCQMNFADTRGCHVTRDFNKGGYRIVSSGQEANIYLIMTCAIREEAEIKIRKKLHWLSTAETASAAYSIRRVVRAFASSAVRTRTETCPDCWSDADKGKGALSLEETYADVNSIRAQPESPAAIVSIMRGCDNHCAFCVVRRRAAESGRHRRTPWRIKSAAWWTEASARSPCLARTSTAIGTRVAAGRTPGFSAVYAERIGGLQFPDLLDRLSAGYPACRFRFTSPHPKDFQPASLLQLIGERPNLARQLHLPAQSGLHRRAATDAARLQSGRPICDWLTTPGPRCQIWPSPGISSADSAARRRLITRIRWSCCGWCVYSFVYHYAYSVRERTRAHRLMKDDVPEEVKMRRSAEVDRGVPRHRQRRQPAVCRAARQLVLIEGDSRRSADWWRGRNDQGIRVLLPKLPQSAQRIHQFDIRVGDFVAARVDSAGAQTLLAEPLAPVPDGPA